MFTIKNIIIIIFAALLATIAGMAIQQITASGSVINFLTTGITAGIIILLAQKLTAPDGSREAPARKKPVRSDAAPKMAGNRETGTVKWFDSNKGYGFITRTSGGDIFVHFRSIKGSGYRSLHEGQSVDFLVTQGDKGPQAEDIHVLK